MKFPHIKSQRALPVATAVLKHKTSLHSDSVQCFPLRPIRTRSAHRQAKSVLRSLIGRRGSAVRDYKSVLAVLVTDYELTANLRLDKSKVTAGQIVSHLIEERGMSVNALAKSLGISQSSLSEMINGRRDWGKQAI